MSTFEHGPRPPSPGDWPIKSFAKGSARYPSGFLYIASQRAVPAKPVVYPHFQPICRQFHHYPADGGVLALLAIIGATIWLGENAQHYADEASLARDTRISAVELRSALQNAESSQRGFLVGGNEIYLAPYNSAKALAQTQFERLKARLGLPRKRIE